MEPYIPESLPPSALNWEALIPQIGPANAELARYDGILRGIVNPNVLLSPLMIEEARLSSKIEGTEASLDEVLKFDAARQLEFTENSEEVHIQDYREILNYRSAVQFATEQMDEHPITLKMIRRLHFILMNSVRGRAKARGEFRKTQNHIGSPGSDIVHATFVPPSPLILGENLNAFERYSHENERDTLVQLGILHAQFEMIHPFLDGNGRIGRMLIPLFLYEKGLLSSPVFYLSAYLEAHRDIYYAKLQNVSRDKDWTGWIQFFLDAIIQQSKENAQKAQEILDLYQKMKSDIADLTHSQYSGRALDAMFAHPVFETTEFASRSEIPRQTAMIILRKMREEGILSVVRESAGSRPAIFVFPQLLSIVNS